MKDNKINKIKTLTRMEDTIAAISTPPGSGAIGIIRISGNSALNVGRRIFCLKNHGTIMPEPRYMYSGSVVDPEDGRTLDHALFVYMKAPRSSTGEDVVELHCHGSMFLLDKILHIICSNGARVAEPGEFTKRAFLNGCLDLTQAEAVIDIINAKSEKALKAASRQLGGELTGEISGFRISLLEIVSGVEASIDFPEDDIETPSFVDILTTIKDIKARLIFLAESFENFNLFKTGIKAAIIGKPNVGKSSLLNRLIGHKRAIVTSIAGTTRDVIEEQTVINNIPVRFIDTAGISESDNEIEKMGIGLTMSKIDEADIILFMLDGSRRLEEDDQKLIHTIRHKKLVIVINKNDLPCLIKTEEVKGFYPDIPVLSISALNGYGIDSLTKILSNVMHDEDKRNLFSSPFVSTVRQKTALVNTAHCLESVVEGVQNRLSPELISSDLRAAMSALGEITGDVTTEEILDSIFSSFCIGK